MSAFTFCVYSFCFHSCRLILQLSCWEMALCLSIYGRKILFLPPMGLIFHSRLRNLIVRPPSSIHAIYFHSNLPFSNSHFYFNVRNWFATCRYGFRGRLGWSNTFRLLRYLLSWSQLSLVLQGSNRPELAVETGWGHPVGLPRPCNQLSLTG